MRQFIKSILSFLLLSLVLLLAVVRIPEILVQRHADFTFQDAPYYLLIGHSHPECAFNDSLINGLKNVAQSGESYFYTYYKTKQLLAQNPSIQLVFIEFTNNQISGSMSDWIWKEKYMDYRYPIYAPFMDLSGNMLLAKHNSNGYVNAVSLSAKENSNRVLRQHYQYATEVGGYKYLVRDKTDSLIIAMNEHPVSHDTLSISEYNLTYLAKTIELCTHFGKDVILIRSPLHDKYPGYFNEDLYKDILTTRYADIPYLDLSRFPLPNQAFGDLEHLNFKGATIFSVWFDTCVLKDGLLQAPDPQKVIDSMMAVLRMEQF